MLHLALVQLASGADSSDELRALRDAVSRAAEAGAKSVIVPCLASLRAEPELAARFRALVADDHPDVEIVIPCASAAPVLPTRLGPTTVAFEDACLEPDGELLGATAALWQFTPESELQAEGILEFAIGTSLHGPGLIVVIATGSFDEGWPARGSAIVQLGQVLAEAGEGDELLLTDLPDPWVRPDTPAPRPSLPPILEQRLAAHQGRKIVPPWPADMH